MPARRIGLAAIGGFVPRWRGCTIEIATLPPDDATTLQGLISTSGILGMRDRVIRGATDVVRYTFTIETDTGEHTVTLDAPSVPASVQPLLQYLLACSHDLLDEVR